MIDLFYSEYNRFNTGSVLFNLSEIKSHGHLLLSVWIQEC